MTRKDAFAKIHKLLFGEEMANAKLKDGTIIQWPGELKEGAAVNVVGEDGNTTPAPDGTHELEDGTKVTCVGGLVTAIEKGAPVEEDQEQASDFEKAFAKHVENATAMEARVAALEAKVTSYESSFASIKESVENTDKTINEKFTKITEIVEAIAAEPVTPVEPPKNVAFKRTPTNTGLKETFMQFAAEQKKNKI